MPRAITSLLLALALALPQAVRAAGAPRAPSRGVRGTPTPAVRGTPAVRIPLAPAGRAGIQTPAALPGTATPKVSTDFPVQPPSALPSAERDGVPRPAAAEGSPREALERLASQAPQDSRPSDEKLKSSGDKSFDNADSGPADAQPAAGGGSGAGSGGASQGPDDGGGPDYPHRVVKFLRELFRSVLFRPNVPVEADLIRAIDASQTSIHIAVYEFKLAGVLEALRRARERGVKVHIILDYSNAFPQDDDPDDDYTPRRSREIWALLREGFDVKVLRGLGEYGINHNKFAVFDYNEEGKPSLAEFGSFNWSWTAENSHYENAQFTDDTARIKALMDAWKWLDSLSKPVTYASKAEDFSWPKTLPPPPSGLPLSIQFNGVALPPVVVSPNRAPGESIEDRLVDVIGASQKTIDISIFALRSTRIVEALLQAMSRGVRLRVIIDASQALSDAFGPYAQWLAFQGLEVRTLGGPDPDSDFPQAQKDHHKFGVFDGKLVETGSANYTKYAAIANFENAHFLDDPLDVGGYAFVFERLWARGKPFPAPAQAPVVPTDTELSAEIDKDAPPGPAKPPRPGPSPGLKPREVKFHDKVFDSYALRPDKPIEPMLVEAIDTSRKSVRIALHEFNLESVMDALRRAKKRGLAVEIVVDRSHVYTRGTDSTGKSRMPSKEILALIEEDFDVLVLGGEKGGIQHSKYAVFDAEDLGEGLVVHGSYNWARTAERNHYENVLFSNQKDDVKEYLEYFKYQRSLAVAVDRKKLEEILSRGEAEAQAEQASHELEEAPAEDLERDSKFPPPPQSSDTPIDLNGEKFHNHYFSPQGGIEAAWIKAILAAKTSVEIAMFGFYSRPIADAIVEAMKKNPNLKVLDVLDAGQAKLSRFAFDGLTVDEWLAKKGVDVKLLAGPNDDGDPMYEKQHNKFMIVDGKFLMTGSFNLSTRAEMYNFENENVTVDPTDVAAFVDFFARMYQRGWDVKPRKGRKKAA